MSAEARISVAESRMKEAEAEVAKLEKEVVMLEVERSRLKDRIDTLEEGNERFFEMKEQQVCHPLGFHLWPVL